MSDLHERGFDDAQPCLQLCRGINKVAADLLNPSLWSREQSAKVEPSGEVHCFTSNSVSTIPSPAQTNACAGLNHETRRAAQLQRQAGERQQSPPKATRFGVFLSLERNLLVQSEERVGCAS